MKAILINRNLSQNELQEIAKFSDVELFSTIGKIKEIAVKDFSLLPDEKNNLNLKIFKDLQKVAEKKIENKTVLEHLQIEETNIWFYHKFRIYFELCRLCELQKLIEKLEKDFEEITVYSNSKLIENFDFKQKISFHYPSQKNKINYRSLFNYGLFVFLRLCLSFFQQSKGIQKSIVISMPHTYAPVLQKKNLKSKTEDPMLGYIIQNAKQKVKILNEVVFPKPKDKKTFKIKKIHLNNFNNKIFVEKILLLGFLNSLIRKKMKSSETKLLKAYEKFQKTEKNSFEKIVLKQIKSFHSASKMYLFRFFSYQKFFEKNKIPSILSVSENSSYIRSIMDAAKTQNVKRFGLQHGAITNISPDYNFSDYEKRFQPFVDQTLLFGSYYKTILEQGNHSSESLKIIGQQRTDIIPKLLKNHDLKLKRNKIQILYATQPMPDYDFRKRANQMVFEICKQFEKDLELIIKPHPSEKDRTYFDQFGESTGLKNYKVEQNKDLYLLLAECDVLITAYSTVGAEVIYFNKPLITLDFYKTDLAGYYKNQVAHRVVEQQDLEKFINLLIQNKLEINQEKYEFFIKNYAYSIDGKVSERCLEEFL